ncbi:glycosyltransferase [Pseudonocardia hispaniensis]|uniref:Glycosyltransferase n=1 Tax=Pseudonocardia hispaniensis TaxID=904933 RepID=A0ABW1J1W7_9PSEU
MVKVLHVITGLGVGGAELQLRSLLRHTRHSADVVTLYNPGPVADMIARDGIRVRDLAMTRNTELPALFRLRDLIAQDDYDVVHTHLYRSCVYGRAAARLAGTPVIVATEHSIGETHLERRRMTVAVRALYLATGLCGDATIAVSDTVRDRLVRWGVPERTVQVIPNGVDLDRVAFDAEARVRVRREFAVAEHDYVVGVLGRLDPNKRFDLVIEAVAPLMAGPVRLLVVGDGPQRRQLESVAARHGVTDRVTFAGERHDVAAVLSAMDLFVASSAQETFGLSVLEAMANGLLALYTTCPALTDVATDRARRVPGDIPGLRAEIAREVATGPRPRGAGTAIRERYGMPAVAGRIDDLYERLMAAGRSPRRRRGRRAARPRAAGAQTIGLAR